ncbi:hypothetical protein SUGI_1009780 [Cryptomeria japonica]|nr:hypothetical protein SUGI_1009780 [Cryptomeria japonica]
MRVGRVDTTWASQMWADRTGGKAVRAGETIVTVGLGCVCVPKLRRKKALKMIEKCLNLLKYFMRREIFLEPRMHKELQRRERRPPNRDLDTLIRRVVNGRLKGFSIAENKKSEDTFFWWNWKILEPACGRGNLEADLEMDKLLLNLAVFA